MGTHFSALQGKKRIVSMPWSSTPIAPQTGDTFFDNLNNRWAIYSGNWYYLSITTTTSTSTSTTTTSTSTTTTSTTTTISTTTSTSTSTTTTL